MEFKKRQLVFNLLKCGEQDIPLHEGESEYMKKRRNEKRNMQRGTKPPREGVRPDRITILRELMIGPSKSNEELLETVPSMSDEELLEAVEGIEEQPDDTNMLEFGGGGDSVEEEENNAGMEENGAFIRVNPDCYGCFHFLPSPEDHACCNYGQQEEPEEEIVQPFEEEVSKFFLLYFLFFVCYVLFLLFPRTVLTR